MIDINRCWVGNLFNLIYSCELVYLHEFSHAIGISDKNKSNLYSKGKFKNLNEAVEEASIKKVYDYKIRELANNIECDDKIDLVVLLKRVFIKRY